ncbi:MAG: hypothetical protein EZS28_022179 [Streblomastix strix]|uniref:Uncharacterized protein n=1 Tax=Streblomastix strix TaxID=222440 RepID=A0A5J4VI31_9EUKA|nr:MAG: hypothetical protein EZS28_022179 [Streblomastix strix]
MRPYPSVEELNQPTTQEHEAIQCTLTNMIVMIWLDNKTNGAVGMLTNTNTEEVLIKINNNNEKKTNNRNIGMFYQLRDVFCEGWTARGSIQSLRPNMAVSQQRG